MEVIQTSRLSAEQYAIALYITGHIQTYQYAPSLSEIGSVFHKGVSLVEHHLSRLQRTPLLSRGFSKSRSLRGGVPAAFGPVAKNQTLREALQLLSTMQHRFPSPDISFTLPLGEDFPERHLCAQDILTLTFPIDASQGILQLVWDQEQHRLLVGNFMNNRSQHLGQITAIFRPVS